MSIPKTTNTWMVTGRNGFDSLEFQENKQIPELGDSQVMVKRESAPEQPSTGKDSR